MAELDYSPFHRFDFPNGSYCFYRDSDHSYYGEVTVKPDGCTGVKKTRLAGISTIAKRIEGGEDSKERRLNAWRDKTLCEGVAQAYRNSDSSGWLNTAETILVHLREEKLTPDDLMNQAGYRGSEAHEALEALCRHQRPDFQNMSEEAKPYAKAVERFWREHHPEVLQCEQVVYSERHGFAGRFDLRCNMDNEVCLLDLKTSKGIYNSFHVQLAGYDLACRECGFGSTDRHYLLHVKPDATYELVEGYGVTDDFVACLGLYRRNQALSDRKKPKPERQLAVAA